MEDILRIINSDPELKAKFETAVDNYCNSREGKLVLAWVTKKHNLTGDQMEALTFALEWADSHTNWISVDDELPPKQPNRERSKNVLVRTNSGRTQIEYYDYGNDVIKEWWKYHVTHWMPLPAPPKKGGEQ